MALDAYLQIDGIKGESALILQSKVDLHAAENRRRQQWQHCRRLGPRSQEVLRLRGAAMTASGVPIQPKDSRGYFMLPQAPEDAGYYVYGNVGGVPGTGHLAQYAHPYLLSMIFWVEREWQAIDNRQFGIGNISLAEGRKYEHATHQKGIEMDIRPIRKDRLVGQAARTSYHDAVYDLEGTVKLVRLFLQHPMVSKVFFNDDRVQKACGGRVRSMIGHNDHLHIEIWECS